MLIRGLGFYYLDKGSTKYHEVHRIPEAQGETSEEFESLKSENFYKTSLFRLCEVWLRLQPRRRG